MQNAVISLQRISSSHLNNSDIVRCHNSGFSYKCTGQSTLSIRCH